MQFIAFTAQLVSKGQKTYQSSSGVLLENVQLDAATGKTIDLNNRLVQSFEEGADSGCRSATDMDIKAICESFNKIAEQLTGALEKLKARVRHSKRHSFRQALKCLRSRHDVEYLKVQLDTIGGGLILLC